MTAQEIELAVSRGEMPEDLELPEMLFALTMQQLYKNYNSEIINRDQAKRLKQRIYVAYGGVQNEYKITKQHLDIRKRLSLNIGELYQCGCPHCRKLLNIFVGVDREDIPQDIKEVNECNKRLRELVKERSERNAELATTIDKARRALEKGDIERAKEILNDHRNN